MRLLAATVGLVLVACSKDEAPHPSEPAPVAPPAHPEWPDTARPEMHAAMVASTKNVFHPSDGGGRAWLEDPKPAHSRSDYSATIVYEVGPLGVAKGGVIFLQVSPYWGWSTPQTETESANGYTRVATDAAGVALATTTVDRQLLAIEVSGRALVAGERVRIEYGFGVGRATADNFSEGDSRFWIEVDGDGDGLRKVLADSPTVPVEAGPPDGVVVHAPSVLRAGEDSVLRVALLDAVGDACRGVAATCEFVDPPAELELDAPNEPRPFTGAGSLAIRLTKDGTYRLKVRAQVGEQTLEGESNPIVVAANAPRIFWADLHGHSSRSDGTGTPAEFYEYARDYAALDAVALTDHDHWGMLPLSSHPEIVAEIAAAARDAERPGKFTALVGFEWTSWVWGHRNVVYFDERTDILSSLDEGFDTPEELWAALRGTPTLAIPHHPAGGPIALDWRHALDPELEPLVEICSAHGSSESDDSPRPIYSAHKGCFARDALERGAAFGMLASGDSHDGHPGLCHLGAHYPTGGVAAVLADDDSRPALLAALRARRVYATSGPRIVLRFALGAHRMGEAVPATEATGEVSLFVQALGTAPIATIEVIRKGERITRVDGDGGLELALSGAVAELVAGDWLYARVVQTDGGMAWSSPIFVR
ncbi:MAG: CehA/McbA family metallohydrolase [Planctomycetes bacterium]|nr:CehA/McbA family metallohydrolase [Planctomycetota bacterium]